MEDNLTPTTIQMALHIEGKNREDTAMKLAQAQLQNNLKYNTGFKYETHWFSQKKVTTLFYIDVKYIKANSPDIKGAN